MAPKLDNVDRGILHLLQRDARHTTAQDIADKVGVSASTVRNRIGQLEAAGVIAGYRPTIDYEAANYPLQVVFLITAPPTDRTEFVEDLLDIRGVVDVRETLTGKRNIHLTVIATSTSDITRMTDLVHELGLKIESSELLKQRRSQPFDQFQYEGELEGEDVDEEDEA